MKTRSIYEDGKAYDLKFGRYLDDVPFLFGEAFLHGGPILELGCGTGRVALPLAGQGLSVTGIDNSPAMLEEARRKSARDGIELELVQADFRDFDLGRRFMAVLFPFNTVAHLHAQEDLERCLECVYRHLKPGGALVIDTFNPESDPAEDDGEEEMVLDYGEDERRVEVWESSVYDPGSRRKRVRWRHVSSGETVLAEEIEQRAWTREEIVEAAKAASLRVTRVHGDFDRTALMESSPRLIVVMNRGAYD